MIQPELVITVVTRGLNHLLLNETWARERLRNHVGAKVQISGGMINLCLGIDSEGYFQSADACRTPDVTLTLPPDVLVRFVLERDKLFSAVKLGGSVDVAETLAFVFRNLQWDAEADLAPIVGDIAARRLVMFGRSLARGLQTGLWRTAENLVEYAVEDSPLLAARCDISDFGCSVANLADQIERLENRISQL